MSKRAETSTLPGSVIWLLVAMSLVWGGNWPIMKLVLEEMRLKKRGAPPTKGWGCERPAKTLWFSPFVRLPIGRSTHALNQWRGATVQLLRTLDSLRLRWKHIARSLGVGSPNGVVPLRTSLYKDLLRCHTGSVQVANR